MTHIKSGFPPLKLPLDFTGILITVSCNRGEKIFMSWYCSIRPQQSWGEQPWIANLLMYFFSIPAFQKTTIPLLLWLEFLKKKYTQVSRLDYQKNSCVMQSCISMIMWGVGTGSNYSVWSRNWWRAIQEDSDRVIVSFNRD